MHERDVVSGMAVFVAVVEGGSLAAAARTTGLTPSAVSKLVARLEEGFGTKLLRRTTRSMTLTEAGQTYFERAVTVLEGLREVEREMASRQRAPRGHVRVSAPLLLGQIHVVPIVLAFQQAFPEVTVDLDLADRAVDLVSERFDLAVRITSAPPASFVCRRVGSLRRVLCASPAYLRERGKPRAMDDLAAHACLFPLGPDTTPTFALSLPTKPGSATVVRGRTRLRASNTLTLHQAALADLGIADLPLYLVARDLEAGRLLVVLPTIEPEPRGVYVVSAPGAFVPTRVRELGARLARDLGRALGELPARAPAAKGSRPTSST